MITGDYPATAKAIAKQLGIANYENILTGQDIESMDDEDLAQKIEQTSVFARTDPVHKLRLVKALQQNNHVTIMTGDGVNDAPALKYADVGVAMGEKGTEIAKESAEMILTDDNFATISEAVSEGRTVYDNLKKAFLFILPTNGGEALTIILAILLIDVLPITPVQILWVNMITAVTLALALAFEPPERDVMKRPPRPRDEPLLSGMLCWRICFVSVLLVIGTFGLFTLELNAGANLDYARCVAINALVGGEIVYLINSRKIYDATCNLEGIFGSRPAVIAIITVSIFQLLFTYLPISHYLFGVESIDFWSWIRIAIFCLAMFMLIEAEKLILRIIRNQIQD